MTAVASLHLEYSVVSELRHDLYPLTVILGEEPRANPVTPMAGR